MQFTNIAVFLFAAMGAIASPVEGNAEIEERAADIEYTGRCYADQTCHFTINGKTNVAHCPTARNKVCTATGKGSAACTYDSYTGKVTDCK